MKKLLVLGLLFSAHVYGSETCAVDTMAIANSGADQIQCTEKTDEGKVSLPVYGGLEPNSQFNMKVIKAMKSAGYTIQAANDSVLYFVKK